MRARASQTLVLRRAERQQCRAVPCHCRSRSPRIARAQYLRASAREPRRETLRARESSATQRSAALRSAPPRRRRRRRRQRDETRLRRHERESRRARGALRNKRATSAVPTGEQLLYCTVSCTQSTVHSRILYGVLYNRYSASPAIEFVSSTSTIVRLRVL